MRTNKIRVLVADDHRIVRLGLSALLATENGIEVVGEAENGEAAVTLVRELNPDVVLLDLVMPEMDGVAATEAIRAIRPETKILILTSFSMSDDISRALAAGASGAILKNASDDELIAAVKAVAVGESVIGNEVQKLLKGIPPIPQLTDRQKQILAMVVDGNTNRQIASHLGIREDSVGAHLSSIFTKLGASCRAEAVAIAMRRHLLKL